MVNRRWIVASGLLVVSMYFISELVVKKELIFPVLAALTLGAWVFGNPFWTSRPFYIWLSPTLSAATSIGLNQLFSIPTLYAVWVLIAFVGLQLYLLHSSVTPSLATAILPVYLQIDTWYYVPSVGVFTAVVATLLKWKMRRSSPEPAAKREVGIQGRMRAWLWRKDEVLQWVVVLIGVVVISFLTFSLHWLFIMAPPLIVTFYEFTRKETLLYKKALRLILLMAAASLFGTLSLASVHLAAGLPVWLSVVVTFGWMLLVFHWLQLPFAPAAAISLLPTVIPREYLWLYPLEVTLGASLFTGLGLLYWLVTIKRRVKQVEPVTR